MNLIACNDCGIVHDKDKVDFPIDASPPDDYGIDPNKATVHEGEWHFYVHCKACGGHVIGDKV